ncbi:hypothetical protein [Actinokineospora cianjurensis]|uniref:Uncharacterized protein n=1 Tax=Actinokineospora cianjurensis TaxID=585224 RepID=A0A421B314_9PSEU|nr:hypothetical protein [Actinokineospora cianjurensis]RLK58769.1 hypothetical protein CLV68_3244 [Actinokineospora cianjurensis]
MSGFRRPAAPPEPVSRAEHAAFAALVAESLPAVRASAAAWRTGLTALVTLITAAVVLQGRRATADLTPWWLLAVTVLIGGGLACCAAGLWRVLAAEAGSRTTTLTLADIHTRHGSVAAYQAALAVKAGKQLRQARGLVAVALCLLFAGTAATWWAPPAPKLLKVTHGGTTTCGPLQSADGGRVRITLPGTNAFSDIRFTDVTGIAVVPSC